jgi:hypothetical protein
MGILQGADERFLHGVFGKMRIGQLQGGKSDHLAPQAFHELGIAEQRYDLCASARWQCNLIIHR